jgi:hypothetical protein
LSIPLTAAAGSIALGNNGRVFASLASSYWGPIGVIDGPAGVQMTTINGAGGTKFDRLIVYDRANDVLITGSEGLSPSSLTRFAYNATAQTLTELQYLWDAGSNGQELVLSPDGLHLGFPDGAGNGSPGYTIFDFNPSNLTVSYGAWDTGAYPRAIAWNPDGTRVLATDGYALKLFNAATHAWIQTFTPNFTGCDYSQLSKTGVSKGGKIGYGFSNCGISDTSGKLFWVLLPP